VSAIVDITTLAGSDVNEDRAGSAGTLAWVIDGATDVIEAPLTTAATDASWAAQTLDTQLRKIAMAPPADLADILPMLTAVLQSEFPRAARREPSGRHEHPSAAALIVRSAGGALDYVAVGDCSLIVATADGIARLGTSKHDAGDRWVAEQLASLRAHPATAPDAAQAQLWPKLRLARRAMNEPGGYGVLSLTPTPQHFIQRGRIGFADGARALIASDGLMRLVDVFRRYSEEELLAAAVERGLQSLTAETRALELADRHCLEFPRAKRHDDASGVLLEPSPRRG
jgi:protein phosphatase 2C-like protein